MHVKVECGADVGMPEQDAHRLIVASAFDASGGKAVSEPVKLEAWDIKLVDQRIVIRAIDAWFGWLGVVGEHIEVGADYAVKWLEKATEFIAQRYVADGTLRLGHSFDQLRVTRPIGVDDIDALECATNADDFLCRVDIRPFQGTELSDAYASAQADEDTQVTEGEMLTNETHNAALMVTGENVRACVRVRSRIADLNGCSRPVVVLRPIAAHHFEYDDEVFDGFRTQPRINFREHEGLHSVFVDLSRLSKGG